MNARSELLLRFALGGLTSHRVRSGLTVLGIAIGTASVVAVVSIGLLGRQYVLRQIEGVGSNLVYAYGTGDGPNPEELSFADADALVARATGVAAAAPVVLDGQELSIRNRPRRVTVLGTPPAYARVRNLVMESGRFYSDAEERAADKLCVISDELARELFGSADAVGRWIRLYDLRFPIVGVFREAVDSAAALDRSEAGGLSAILPFTTLRNLSGVRFVDVVYLQAESAARVEPVVQSIREILAQRHRSLDGFKVESLESYLAIARRVSDGLSATLLAIAAISLLVGGIGIMNILLVAVAERTREIGIRMALGARRRDILIQVLVEAALLALAGAVIGTLIGVGAPLYLGRLAGVSVPVSPISVGVAFCLSLGVGVVFGLYPARRAAGMNLVDALGYE